MASPNLQEKIYDTSVNLLPFVDHIEKIPELQKVNHQNYHQLPCSNDYSIVSIYVDLFKILSVLFGEENLRTKVLTHIRKHWKYYQHTAQLYLHQKKLSLAQWLTQMRMYQHIPADKICLHACRTYLNIHISVVYIGGTWTTLDTSDTSHKSQIGLCDMQLAYMGSNTYNLLCKPSELKTKARKLLNHKYGQSHAVTTKDLQIKLLKAEYLTQWPDNLIITQESMKKLKQYRVKTPGESLPSSLGNYLQKPNNEELYNTSTELYTDSEDTELYYVSDSTELYELDELLVGTIQIHDTKMGATKTKTSLTSTVKPENNSVKLFTFKCPFIKCSVRSNTRKSLHQHYTTSH